MEIEQLIEEVIKNHSSVSQWRSVYASKEWQQANKLNKALFGMSLNQSPKCECIEDLYKTIFHRKFKNQISMNTNRKFKLKPTVVIMLHGCEPVTANSPEEKLIEVLRMSPGHIVSFESVPDNWKELVSAKTPAATKEDEVVSEAPTEAEAVVENDGREEGVVAEETKPEVNEDELREDLSKKTNPVLKDLIAGYGLELPEDTRKPSLVETLVKHLTK